jgi:putative endonuclease
MSSNNTYCVYLLECCDGSYYCGITTDMQQRLKQHNAGIASRYTRGRTPITVIARTPNCYSKSEALKLEHRIKKYPKDKKPEIMAMLTKQDGEDYILK